MNSMQHTIKIDTAKSPYKYFLGFDSFRTWSDVAKYASDILSKGERHLNIEEIAFAKELLKYHVQAKEKLKNGISSIRVGTPSAGTWFCFIIKDMLGNEFDMSYKKCRPLSKRTPEKAFKSEKRQLRMKAYRQAISKEIRPISIFEQLQVCNCCGYESNLQVDHIIPFVHLINEFEKFYNVDDNVEILKQGQSIYPYYFADTKLVKAWQEFHRTNVKYQLLCTSCNSAKNSSGMKYTY